MTNSRPQAELWEITLDDLESAVILYRDVFNLVKAKFSDAPYLLISILVPAIIAASNELQFDRVNQHNLLMIPLALGGFSGLAFIRESFISSRGFLAKVCFCGAGIVLLVETLLLLMPNRPWP